MNEEKGNKNQDYKNSDMGLVFIMLGSVWLVLALVIGNNMWVYLPMSITFLAVGLAYFSWKDVKFDDSSPEDSSEPSGSVEDTNNETK